MNKNRVIQALIFEPCTAADLASASGNGREEILCILQELSIDGLVRPVFNQAPGDVICGVCGEEDQDAAQPGDSCIWKKQGCLGWLIDNCKWVYFGGPISRAFEEQEAA